MRHSCISFFLLFVFKIGLFAQTAVPADTLLTADEALAAALSANFDIRLSAADVEIARLNNTRANAGQLPTINFTANETFTLSTFQQKLANGSEFDELGVPFNNFNAALVLNWTIYDGRRKFIAKRRLEALEQLGDLNLQAVVQQTAADVLRAYYNIVQSRLQEGALAEVIALNEERLRIAEARLAAGFAAQTDALQARLDLNQRRADLVGQQTTTAAAKRALNRLLVRDPNTPLSVDENLTNTYKPEREYLAARLQTNNAALRAFQKNAEVSALLVEEARTLRKPRLVGISQLTGVRTDNGSGFVLNNTQAGLAVGAGLNIPVYNGGNLKRQVEVARVQAEQAGIQVEAQRQAILTQLDDQLAFFLAQQQVLVLEEENVSTARQALNISTERFRLGQTNALEVQVAQNSLEQALARRNLVLYNVRLAQINLQLLAGEL